jgi:hypothetical protein
MSTPNNLYEPIFDILHQVGIRSRDDVKQLKITTPTKFVFYPVGGSDDQKPQQAIGLGGFDFVKDKEYPWVRDLFSEMRRIYPAILESCEGTARPLLISERMYNAFGARTWEVDDEVFNLRAKYSCLFPRRMLFLSHQFVHWEMEDEIGIPLDFFPLLFALEPVLKSGLAHLLPSRMNRKEFDPDVGEVSNQMIGTWHLRQAKENVEIPASGSGYKDLESAMRQQKLVEADTQLMTLPWLLGARLEDYVDVVQEFPEEFELYSGSLAKFLKTDKDVDATEWIKEISHGVRRIDVIFKNKQRELNAKGLDVGVGMLFTLGTLFLPEALASMKPALAALFSSKTAYDGIRWFYDYQQAAKLLSSENYWIMWRLKK